MLKGVMTQVIAAVALAGLFALSARPVLADSVARQVSFTDETRGVKASMGYAGSDTRRIDVKVWYPSHGQGPLPLIIYSHGTFGFASNAMHLVNALVEAGYIVAAPDYPLTSREAYTHIAFADVSDTAEQVKDIHFLIDRLLADPDLGKRIDPERIGTTGHSLGAVTSYFASFGARTRDPRIKATAPIAGGDPVQAALDAPMGMAGAGYSPVSVPVLFLSAEHDVFSSLMGPHHVAFARASSPKYEILVSGGVHVWFRDGDERPEGNKNPDCLFFEEHLPDISLPICAQRVPLIDPLKQQAITREAIVSFFDAYLKGDAKALERLASIHERFPEAALMAQP